MLLYDGHLVGGLQGRQQVEVTVGKLTPPGTYSVMINDEQQRIFNVDSVDRLTGYLRSVEKVQGPLASNVTFTVSSSDGSEGTVKGKGALLRLLREKFATGPGAKEGAPGPAVGGDTGSSVPAEKETDP